MGSIRRFLSRYVVPNLPWYGLGFVMLFATNWVIVRIPAIIGESLTILEEHGPQALAGTRSLALELIFLGALVIVVRSLSRILFFNPGRQVEYRVGVDVFGHLLSLQRPFYMQRKVGELVSIASNDTTSVRLLVGFAALQVCNVAVAIPLHLYQMAVTDWTLTLWCLIPVLFGAIYMQAIVRKFFGMVRDSMQMLARVSDRILEIYSGIGTVRSHAAEAAAFERFDLRNREYLDLQLRIARVRAFSMPVLGFSGLVGTGSVSSLGGCERRDARKSRAAWFFSGMGTPLSLATMSALTVGGSRARGAGKTKPDTAMKERIFRKLSTVYRMLTLPPVLLKAQGIRRYHDTCQSEPEHRAQVAHY